tara:strand:- start:542 stop:1474 length:933 start_codon:yes stop_codon:yes gene_type:complete
MKVVTVFGGSGFLGRYVVRQLASRGLFIRVIVRNPNDALFLKVYGKVGQIQLIGGDIKAEKKIHEYIKGSSCVINCVATFFETRSQSFNVLHVNAAKNLAKVTKQEGVNQFIHISSLGASTKSTSQLLRSKGAGEEAVLECFPNANIIRPSLIFGAEDTFFNRFAKLSSISPFIPVVGPETKFQPVYVDDVAKVISLLVETGQKKKYLELGGDEIYTFRELIKLLLVEIKRKRLVLKIPFSIARVMAATNDFFRLILGDVVPAFLTLAQVKSLEKDNIVGSSSEKFSDFGVVPKNLKIVLPTIVGRYNKS